MCRVLEVPRSSYYGFMRKAAKSEATDRQLLTRVRRIYAESRQSYGVRRVHAALRAEGLVINHKRVARIMRQEQLQGMSRRRARVLTTRSDAKQAKASNVLNRQFHVSDPNRWWSSDITYIRVSGGKFVYLVVVLDLFSRRVIGWNVSSTMESTMVASAIRAAILLRDPEPGLVFHSDQGSQYGSQEVVDLLSGRQITRSMSRRGNCWDNAVSESFFATLKCEFLDDCRFSSLAALRREVGYWIEIVYNRHRRHSTLGYLSPVDFERLYYTQLHNLHCPG